MAVVSEYFQRRPISPLDAAVNVIAVKVAGTRYSRAGCPSFVMALAANATPNPMTYAACVATAAVSSVSETVTAQLPWVKTLCQSSSQTWCKHVQLKMLRPGRHSYVLPLLQAKSAGSSKQEWLSLYTEGAYHSGHKVGPLLQDCIRYFKDCVRTAKSAS